ncbi:MAG: CoA-binding protein [Rhodoferax sp.]
MVGLSAEPDRPSHEVAQYLQAQGYRIVPINPKYAQILGQTCYADLAAVPFPIDVVDVFRKPQDCVPIAEQAVAVGAKVLWLQLGVVNPDARAVAERAGLTVVMDRCIKIEHRRCQG